MEDNHHTYSIEHFYYRVDFRKCDNFSITLLQILLQNLRVENTYKIILY